LIIAKISRSDAAYNRDEEISSSSVAFIARAMPRVRRLADLIKPP
jgi:hypothetical protein